MSTDGPNHGRDDHDDELRRKLAAVERRIEDLIVAWDLREGRRGGAREPDTPGRIMSLVFVKLAGRRVRVTVDDLSPLIVHQTVAFALMALARPGGVTEADGREYQLAEAIAAEIGRLRGTPPPSRQAVATYVARLRKELAKVRTDGKDLILGDMSGGWRLALHEKATVRLP